MKGNKNKKNSEIEKIKRRNRLRILRFILTLFMVGISIKIFFNLDKLIIQKEEIKEKNSFLLSKSFLTRKKYFYKDDTYQREFFLIKKDWIEDKGGLKIDERDKEER